MKIDRVTITGADDKTSATDLWLLQDKYPFVEWGILFSKSKEGEQRYPTLEKIELFSNAVLNLSAHFCGAYARNILEEKKFDLFGQYPLFDRFQLNYNFDKSSGWDLLALNEYAMDMPFSVILQWNKANKSWLYQMQEDAIFENNFNFLYDSSGGRGKMIAEIEQPLNYYTGYSGGISPDNIKDVKAIITHMASNKNVWIDMESGVRTNNELDLNKVEEVLKVCAK